MHHRKLKHSEMVQKCKNEENCVFEKSKSCWFSHELIGKIRKDETEKIEGVEKLKMEKLNDNELCRDRS